MKKGKSRTRTMKVVVVGTGYVGLVTGVIFSKLGNNVVCVDKDKAKVKKLKQGVSPIYEPGLEVLLKQNIRAKRLRFTTSYDKEIAKARAIFIAVGTPSRPDGSVNLDFVKTVAKSIGATLAKFKARGYRVIVNKSTVPIGTGNMVEEIIKKNFQGEFDVVSNPEFLREGSAIKDALNPDRIVIGNGSKKAGEIMRALYAPFDCPKLFTDIRTAEMIKYASNAFLATSISFINSVAVLCEKLGANVAKVSEGMKLDKRIGARAFLDAGAGYGGSCFPKDVAGLIDIAQQNNLDMPILEATEQVNKKMRQIIIEKINRMLKEKIRGKRVAIWGVAFKPQTDDVRDAPALTVIQWLLDMGARVVAYDPIAQANAKKVFSELRFATTPLKACQNADLLVVMTQWDEFKSLDLGQIAKAMRQAKMIDTRNVFGKGTAEKNFSYRSIG